MAKKRTKTKLFHIIELLEARQLLAVDTAVENGLLKVSGNSDGAVEIVAKANSQFEVTDNGVSVGTFDGVKSISINLDAASSTTAGTANNVVTLKLDGASVDRVMANLGGGDNSLILASGSIKGSLSFKGGSGIDTLELATGTSIGRNVYAALGDGANVLTDHAAIKGSLQVIAGEGADTISILADATIGKSLEASLGNGANKLSVAGSIDNNLLLKTGTGDDAIAIETSGYVGGSVLANLGAGDNSLTHSGEIAGDLRIQSKTSTDTVVISDDSIVGGRTVQRLGVGFGRHRGDNRDSGNASRVSYSVSMRGR
jgi:hypothetical protein